MFAQMLLTFRQVLRGLEQQRGYSAAVVLTLALTIGATTAIFSAVYAILLNPLPKARPDALVICWERAPERNLPVVELSYRAFDEWRLHSRSFATAAAVGSSTWPGVLERGEPARVATAGVSASFFETLGAAPALGRAFTPDDDLPNAAPVTILSHSIWTTRWLPSIQSSGEKRLRSFGAYRESSAAAGALSAMVLSRLDRSACKNSSRVEDNLHHHLDESTQIVLARDMPEFMGQDGLELAIRQPLRKSRGPEESGTGNTQHAGFQLPFAQQELDILQ